MENFMEFIQTVLAQDFGFSDEETMHSLQECLKKLHVSLLIMCLYSQIKRSISYSKASTKDFLNDLH